MKSGSRWFSVVKVVDRLLKKTGALGLMDDQPRVASNRKMPRTDPPIAAARFSASVLDGAASTNEHEGHMKVLITGASGYVGSHLVPALLDAGHHVRAVARHPEVLEARGWEGVEIRRMDALDATSVQEAVSDMDAAYYLIHSMGGGKDFAERDRRAATIFATAAGTAGLQQIIYLGGLLPPGEASRHLTSRAETGSILRVGSVPVTELRAGIIVGPGSAAFEVIRDLVNHLPVMLTPRWVRSRTQPIALTDLLAYLVAMLDLPTAEGRILDVGGPQVLRYEDMLREAGRVLGHRVRVLSLPFLTPRLSSYWLDIVTAVPASVVRPLIDSLRYDLLADTSEIEQLVPRDLTPFDEAVRQALHIEQEEALPARWAEGALAYRDWNPNIAYYAKGEQITADSDLPSEVIWREVQCLGGSRGYPYGDRLWRLRGWLDRLVGGVGLRRGRRHPEDLRVGDALDFWRVVALEPGRRLTLVAEMRLPGSAVLELEVTPRGTGSRLTLSARFHPAGFAGLAYWYALKPIHDRIFRETPRSLIHRAQQAATAGDQCRGAPHDDDV